MTFTLESDLKKQCLIFTLLNFTQLCRKRVHIKEYWCYIIVLTLWECLQHEPVSGDITPLLLDYRCQVTKHVNKTIKGPLLHRIPSLFVFRAFTIRKLRSHLSSQGVRIRHLRLMVRVPHLLKAVWQLWSWGLQAELIKALSQMAH